jgi:glycosyltransferase involved in cell wall biosynthesis
VLKSGDKEDLKEKIVNVYNKGYPRYLISHAKKALENRGSWKQVSERYSEYLNIKTQGVKKIYFLYADKWRISYKWSGASINVINEMALLSESFEVYYNDIIVNDLFDNGVFDEDAFSERYSDRLRLSPQMSKFLPKVLLPSQDYYAYFYRSGNKQEQIDFYNKELSHPKIYSHNYVESIWRHGIVGFQTETAAELAAKEKLKDLGDDGTLGYQDISNVPRKTFIRYQGIPGNMPCLEVIREKKEVNRIKKKLDSHFIIGISGTIYEHTYPYSLLEVIKGLRKKYPQLNICLVAYVVNMLEPLPNEKWIHVTKFDKGGQEDALLELDVFVNTWKHEQQIYGGSNKNLDALSLGIPIITPRTPAIEEQLGSDYPLYFTFDSAEKRLAQKSEVELWSCIESCFSKSYREKVSEHLLSKRLYRSNHVIRSAYEKQLHDLHNVSVLMVAQNFNVGGVQKYSMQMLRALSNCKVTLVTEENISKDQVRKIEELCNSLKIVKLHDFFEDDDVYNVAFLNSFPVEEDVLSSLISKLRNQGCLVYPIVHTDIHIFTRNLSRCLEKCSGIITVAEKIIKKLEVNTHRKISHMSHLITPVLDTIKNFSSYPKPKSERSFKIGYFGRIVSIKGIEFLVKSFMRFTQEENSKYELHLYGPVAKPYLEAYIDQVASESNGKRVFLHNRTILATERERILEELDALVYTTAMDGLPYTFLEAMEKGTPVLSTDVGGIGHLIRDKYNGMIFDFPDLYVDCLFEDDPYKVLLDKLKNNEASYYAKFKSVMTEFVNNDKLLYEMSKNSIFTVNENFNYSVMMKKVRSLLY